MPADATLAAPPTKSASSVRFRLRAWASPAKASAPPSTGASTLGLRHPRSATVPTCTESLSPSRETTNMEVELYRTTGSHHQKWNFFFSLVNCCSHAFPRGAGRLEWKVRAPPGASGEHVEPKLFRALARSG